VGRKNVTVMPSLLSRLYLMRHGETAWSLSGQHTGRTDIPLTEQGEQDARKLAERLRAVKFSRVFTSPLQRARRTCELAGLGEIAEIEPDLAEWDYGDYEGQRPIDIRNARPDWNVFRDGCPGGESPARNPGNNSAEGVRLPRRQSHRCQISCVFFFVADQIIGAGHFLEFLFGFGTAWVQSGCSFFASLR
jgi:hypothetical protein